jgi:5'-methylthioadenosine phosphorylase
MTAAEIGVFGGSGFYSLLDDVEQVEVDTPWGPPSDAVHVGTLDGRSVAFLPRHGADHRYPPHRINYRANAWALRELGVTRVLGPCASGSLRVEVEPGHFVVCDQLVDRTSGRAHTFFDGPTVHHLTFADPYCPELRRVALSAAEDEGITAHDGGTVVVIEGPRFSTRAESAWFASMGWSVINMTQYPEAALARELGLCYAAIALITDYDVGVEGDTSRAPVTIDEVFAVMADNNDRVRQLLFRAIAAIPADRGCDCGAGAGGLDPEPPA